MEGCYKQSKMQIAHLPEKFWNQVQLLNLLNDSRQERSCTQRKMPMTTQHKVGKGGEKQAEKWSKHLNYSSTKAGIRYHSFQKTALINTDIRQLKFLFKQRRPITSSLGDYHVHD